MSLKYKVVGGGISRRAVLVLCLRSKLFFRKAKFGTHDTHQFTMRCLRMSAKNTHAQGVTVLGDVLPDGALQLQQTKQVRWPSPAQSAIESMRPSPAQSAIESIGHPPHNQPLRACAARHPSQAFRSANAFCVAAKRLVNPALTAKNAAGWKVSAPRCREGLGWRSSQCWVRFNSEQCPAPCILTPALND